MTRSVHPDPWLSLSLLALVCVLQACSNLADDCKRNGRCVEGTMDVGGNGVTTTSTACDSHPECGSCDGGVLQPTAAGALCEGDQLCDDEGNCIACDDTAHPCPSGYDCNGGKCGLAKGVPCTDHAMCASGFCVWGYCCANECAGDCRTCDSTTDFTCVLTPMYSGHEPTCEEAGYACDGEGNCKAQINTPCTTHADCISNYCAPAGSFGKCQLP